MRLWPGVVIVIAEWLLITVPGWIVPATFTHFITMMWGPVLAVLALAVWWVLASRLRWTDRWLGLLACAAAGAAAYPFFNSGFGLFGVAIYALPVVTTAWVLWLVLTPLLRWPVRRVGLVVVFVLAWGYFTLLRFEGIDGNMSATFQYRWRPTAEQRFLAEIAAKPRSEASADRPAAEPLTLQPGDWPGFRGPDRDGRRTGVRIATDWKASPPRLLWRHRIGPGWSSFAVVGTHLYTQEQRDDSEAVVCYDRDSGTEIWAHSESTRFAELVSGPGPRATPTFHDGKIYAQGAAGRLLCLDAASGRVVWSRDIVADSGAKVPTWGFSASPLITQGVVTVFAGGPDGKMVLGYNAASGDLLWNAGEEQVSYCSLHPVRLEGVEQLVLTTGEGLIAFDPTRGEVLWQHSWPLDKGMARVVQPTVLNDSDLLLGSGFGRGTRRVHIQRKGDGWETQEVWTSRAINPYFNDLVVHRGYLYGFDGNFFTCVSLEGGEKKWRTRGYGNGQVLLLADQDLLLVLSEKGEVALVDASPDGYKERGRFQAIEGKTWNHPVVAHGKLFVRNGEEVACYQLGEASSFLSHAR
ncbi:MAG TPA: PQQ-binding-like beta-propeller repeat protein [Gemmataceae bacterium]|nr:PQQ-binding-like beta-propeller repeat protein [Gemmataceae bacterium]